MTNYSDAKIYKIVGGGMVYIGSTCKTLQQRLSNHVSNLKRHLKGKYPFVSSFRIIETEEYEITLLELYPCDCKNTLLARERHWTSKMDCINMRKNQGLKNELGVKEYVRHVNKTNYITKKEKRTEYYNANREVIKQRVKKYQLINKVAIKERRHIYYTNNKEIINLKIKHNSRRNQINKLISLGLSMIKELDRYFIK